MPRTYARRHRARGALPFGAVATTQRQAQNPYRAQGPDPLLNGVANAAAALFRAPGERAQIEDRRKAEAEATKNNAQATAYQHSRDDKNDLFREKQLATSHADAQDRIKAMGVAAAAKQPGGASGDAKMSPFPSIIRESHADPDNPTKEIHTQRPVNDDEMTAMMKNQARLRAANSLNKGANPGNGQPLGAGNPYTISKPQQLAEADALFVRQNGGVPPAAAAPAAPAQAAAPAPAQNLFGPPPAPAAAAAPAANDPHAIAIPGLSPAEQAQAQAVSKVIATAHPAVQQAYGTIAANVIAAQRSGNPAAIADATQRLTAAHALLLGQAPAPAAAALAPDAASAPRQGLGVVPGM